mmetsp:Transcript_118971/g.341829  ORF Transcript_118971/g.341829 Transcript_118971/m.341829 type:complete len:281 (-) Transcript_118971:213-1055(-)|eukprot:CAMPEP_0170240088 /NCGR_PEP_ID=MMETSP0116_2-20130129/19801_1 /TAXON_ID=400756 /ORGANISM="Durinskia baltica, Strain CSIRO CS-38" /LENGTH=280 /DNA_ID=CAMNT_0010490905 /DNA_START=68 /DNA_END=910 /DNA_ORIENTATION=-
MSPAADLEWMRTEADEFSEDSDRGPTSRRGDGGRWGRIARSAAVGVMSAVVVLCVFSLRASTGTAKANALGAIGFSDEGAQSAEMALKEAGDIGSKGGNQTLAPLEHLHDGNPCGDDEEFFGGLCYDKCSALTEGKFAFRHSPWSCCNKADCGTNIFAFRRCCVTHIGMCSAFDIAGMQEGNKICPHKPGVCMADEELFLDLCYMKCALLTNNMYPYRTAAATCCKAPSGIGCLLEDGAADGMDGQAITGKELDVGGGCGDHKNSTPCGAHEPQQRLTEG